MIKKFLLIVIITMFFILLNITNVFAFNSITYFDGNAIKIDNEDIEILSNEITIDTNTSKVENTIVLKNTTKNDIKTDIVIPLENEQMYLSIHDLSIVLNNEKVDYVKNNDGEYIIKTKIPKESGKKLEITYFTDNNLKNAKVIKYNFDNYKNRTIGKLKVNVIIEEKEIPLIEKIYPGHYKFNNNTISVEYYDYNVTKITKEIIIQKETFNNLLYGRENNLTDEEIKIVKNWYDGNTKNINTSVYRNGHFYNGEYPVENNICRNIIDAIKIKNGFEFEYFYEIDHPLLYEMSLINMREDQIELKGKTVCIEFVETEGDKKLYVEKRTGTKTDENGNEIYINGFSEGIFEYVVESERNILKTRGQSNAYTGKRGARFIYVGEGINGEKLNATEEEIINYINSINCDMYIRIEIYDGAKKTEKYGYRGKAVGYYNNKDLEMANYFERSRFSEDLTAEELTANNDSLIKLDNKYISDNCKVPTLVNFIGNRIDENNRYTIQYTDCYDLTFNKINYALKTSQAKKLISENRKENDNKKNTIEEKINNLELLDNEKEIQEEIKAEIENERKKQEEERLKKEQEKNKDKDKESTNIQDYIVYGIIGLLIIVCFIILIKENKKRKKKGK